MKLWKYSGILLVITGIVHTLVGFWIGGEKVVLCLQDGLWNSVFGGGVTQEALKHHLYKAISTVKDVDRLQRFGMLWFFWAGFFWIGSGYLGHKYIHETNQALPRLFGWFLVFYGGIGAIILPASGFWSFFPQALIILLAPTPRQ